MHGTISSIENHGSIVIAWLDVEDAEHPVYMDRFKRPATCFMVMP
jgi:hypothetical protein